MRRIIFVRMPSYAATPEFLTDIIACLSVAKIFYLMLIVYNIHVFRYIHTRFLINLLYIFKSKKNNEYIFRPCAKLQVSMDMRINQSD